MQVKAPDWPFSARTTGVGLIHCRPSTHTTVGATRPELGEQHLIKLKGWEWRDRGDPTGHGAQPGTRQAQRLGGITALGTGYRPGCGPEPALKSARRRRPAACSTQPRPSCSLEGSWPVGQHWWYDLEDKEQTSYGRGGRGRSFLRPYQPLPKPT